MGRMENAASTLSITAKENTRAYADQTSSCFEDQQLSKLCLQRDYYDDIFA